MSTPDGLSLADYAATKAKQRSCRVCDLPELKEIRQAYEAGVKQPTIMAWLVDVRGYEASWITRARIAEHFRGGHDA